LPLSIGIQSIAAHVPVFVLRPLHGFLHSRSYVLSRGGHRTLGLRQRSVEMRDFFRGFFRMIAEPVARLHRFHKRESHCVCTGRW
jgi:hypothetical protein